MGGAARRRCRTIAALPLPEGPMPQTPAPLSPEDAAALYQALRAEGMADALTTLHIGGAHTRLLSGAADAPALLRTLDIGARVTAATCFAHQPPTEAELEHAIMLVEDAVMPVRDLLAPGSTLYTADGGIRQIALAAGLPAQPELRLPLEAVEHTFNRLAALSLGRPATQDTLAQDNAFAATLLILREGLHHLGFDHIVVRSDAVV